MFIYTINLDMIEEPDQGSGSSKDYHPMSPGIVILAVWEDRLVVGHMTYVSCTKLFFLGSWNLLFFFFPGVQIQVRNHYEIIFRIEIDIHNPKCSLHQMIFRLKPLIFPTKNYHLFQDFPSKPIVYK